MGERIARPKEVESTRPLTAGELAAAKVYADAGLGLSRRPLLLALAVAGGTASEIASVRWSDIKVDAGTVAFGGSAARTCPLDEWGIATVRRFVQNRPTVPDELVAVNAASGPERAAQLGDCAAWADSQRRSHIEPSRGDGTVFSFDDRPQGS